MSFTAEQVAQLLRPINERRVLRDANGKSHVSQQDVRAHLIRIFGFGGWDKEILDFRCVRDTAVTIPAKPGRNGQAGTPARENVPAVTYLCRLRLTVYCPDRCCRKVSEDVGTGTSPNLPGYGDAHDFAAKNAVSYALKRCATDLGDQFGLSLYNKGQTKALVVQTLVDPRPDRVVGEVDAGVPQQESLGDDDGQQAEQATAPTDNRTAEQVEADETRNEILRFVTEQSWDSKKVAATFQRERGIPIQTAGSEQLVAFLRDLQLEAQAERDKAGV